VNLRLLSVGRPRDPETGALHDRYAERIRRLGVDYRCSWVAEVRAGTRYSDAHVRQREAEGLRRALGPRAAVVAVDPRGREIDSRSLARRLERWATREATFVVGGPLGLDAELCDSAEWVWSLSRLTFPHELARVLVAEQLYRALTILRGIPYHK